MMESVNTVLGCYQVKCYWWKQGSISAIVQLIDATEAESAVYFQAVMFKQSKINFESRAGDQDNQGN